MIGVWVVLTIVGAVASGQLDSRWYQSSPVPGAPAYEAGQRSLEAFGAGDRAPNVVVFHGAGDVTTQPEVRRPSSARPRRDARRPLELVLLDR